jgi:hypothetical protein
MSKNIKDTLKLALEALDNLMYWDNGKPDYDEAREAITAIEEALAQLEQEPVAWGNLANWCLDSDRVLITDKNAAEKYHRDIYDLTALYTTPQQRKPLTDEQIESVWRVVQTNDFHDCVQPFARAIEAAHGIKE